MDHSDAVRLKATERYLLNELDTDQLDQFEEHLFDCPECAVDVRAGAMFLEQAKNQLAPSTDTVPLKKTTRSAWSSWLRPAFAIPALAMLIVVIGYQNLVTFSASRQPLRPQVMPWASVNVGTWGAGGPAIKAKPGQGFLLFVRIPPDNAYLSYAADLYNPAGKLEWSLAFPANAGQDQWPLQVPGSNWQAGTYTLKVRGTTPAGDSKDLGRTSFDLQIRR